MKQSLSFSFLLALLFCIFPLICPAQVIIASDRTSTEPFLSLPIQSLEIKTEIRDQVAVTRVKQVFTNPQERAMEGTYIFSIPATSSVSKFTLEIDGKQVEADLMEKDKAEKEYQDIVRKMRDPGILSFSGTGMIKARIFPIEPKKTKQIEIQYEEILTYDHGTSQYEYNLATDKVCKQPIELVKVEVQLKSSEPLRNLYSPSHQVDITRSSEKEAAVKYSDENVSPEDDFLLFFSISEKAVGLNVLSYKEKDEKGYFMLLASPEIAKPDQAIPKDMIFVIDKSGSMRENGKIDQAKNALKYCLNSLNEKDRMAVVVFSDTVEVLTKEMALAEKNEIEKIQSKVKALDAGGGTNIDGALEKAFQFVEKSDRPTYLLFLTDGLPTVGERNANTILKHAEKWNEHSCRVFSFGVGFDVNTILLNDLSQTNKGLATYVKPNEEIESSVSSLYSKIADPALSDLDLDFGSMEISSLYPQTLPDLFRGSQLVVLGRYDNGGSENVTLTGKVGGESKSFTDEFAFTKQDTALESLPRLWAARRIGYLMAELRKQGENKELMQEIMDLSEKYGILSEYTSFLVKESPIAATPLSTVDLQERLERRSSMGRDNALSLGQAVTGAGSVAASELLQDQLQNAGALSVQNRVQRYDSMGNRQVSRIQGVRFAGNQAFFQRDQGWISTQFDANQTVIQVKPFSNAYFQLANLSKEVAGILALGTEVSFLRNQTMVQIDPNGAEELSEEQLEQLR